MANNAEKGFVVDDNGILFENGISVLSGAASPQGIINPTVQTFYFQTNGDVWYHSGSGGISAWLKTDLSEIPSLSQVPVFAGNGTLTSVTYYSSATQITANRIALTTFTYDANLNPQTETTVFYSTADGTTALKTITRTYTFVSNVLTNVTQVTT